MVPMTLTWLQIVVRLSYNRGFHDSHMVAHCNTSQLQSWFAMVSMTLTWLQIVGRLSYNHGLPWFP